VTIELNRLYRSGQITNGAYSSYSASWSSATTAAAHLRGTRASELKAVLANLQGMAAAHDFTPSRLPVLFLTLDRNRQWWTTGPIPFSRQEIEFTGSNLVWEYYPGQGLELQVLATFGRADGLYTAGRTAYSQLQSLLAEMIPLAVGRAGGLVWEYYFHFDGGAPPWTSAMAQGTAIEALTRAAKAFGPAAAPPGSSQTYLQIAHQALGLFTVGPPTGTREVTPAGARYLQYSFAPNTDIINAFLQSLIGLYDYAQTSHDPEAQQLFAAGNAQAQAELPKFDTGAWSLYQPGVEDDLSYHELVTGFLQQLCSRTRAAVYCGTAQHFQTYMKTAPTLRLLTTQAMAKKAFRLRFSLSKYSHVGIVITRGQQTVLSTSAYFPYRTNSIAVPALKAGTYQVVLAATDLPGNFGRLVGTLQVSPAQRAK
jgi:D-glucuronyl C5-epimerase C-terminus